MRPSHRREMAQRAVRDKAIPIRLACEAFRVSESCYRYEAKNNAQNELIANWLIRLTDNNRSWGFGLCYLYLRNVKNFKWNHKRIYRIYKALELNLRIKPRKRLVQDKPDALVVPLSINQVWSMVPSSSVADLWNGQQSTKSTSPISSQVNRNKMRMWRALIAP